MKTLRNERGNITLFTVGSMIIVMLMFIFVINLAKVFAVKEQAHTSAQQASLAATAVLYDEIWTAIDKYEITIMGLVDSYPKTIEQKVDERTIALNNSHPDWSGNEAYVEAIDQVLIEEMNSGVGTEELRQALQNELNPSIIYSMKEQARQTILANGGTLTGAEMELFHDNRVYVKAANTMESIDYGSIFHSFKDDVYQTGAGPEINFLEELHSWSDRIESLE